MSFLVVKCVAVSNISNFNWNVELLVDAIFSLTRLRYSSLGAIL